MEGENILQTALGEDKGWKSFAAQSLTSSEFPVYLFAKGMGKEIFGRYSEKAGR